MIRIVRHRPTQRGVESIGVEAEEENVLLRNLLLAQLGIEMIDEKHPHVHPGLGVADLVAWRDQHDFVLIVPPTQLAHWLALIGIQQCGVHLEAAFLQEWNQAALDVIHDLVLVNPIPAFGRTVGGPRITTAMPGIQNDVELKARVVLVGGVFAGRLFRGLLRLSCAFLGVVLRLLDKGFSTIQPLFA